MKKLFMIVATPFWIVNVETIPQLNLQPAHDLSQLQKRCAEFELSSSGETDAASLDFSRRPRREILFEISDLPAAQRGLSLRAEISELKDLELVPTQDSLSVKSVKLGLSAAGAKIEIQDGRTVLKVAGLDLACDLIAQKMQIKAQAPLFAGPSSEIILKINENLARIENIIREARAEKNLKVAAAQLGYRFAPEELKLAFNQLLDKKNLALTDNWETFGGAQSIRYEKTKEAGIAAVTLSVPGANEMEIRDTEKKLVAFAGFAFESFTPKQKMKFTRLNQHKARLLRKLILQKIQRRSYAL